MFHGSLPSRDHSRWTVRKSPSAIRNQAVDRDRASHGAGRNGHRIDDGRGALSDGERVTASECMNMVIEIEQSYFEQNVCLW